MSEGWKYEILTEWMRDEKMKEWNINWMGECPTWTLSPESIVIR